MISKQHLCQRPKIEKLEQYYIQTRENDFRLSKTERKQ